MTLTEADFPAIEARMAEHVAAAEGFERAEVSVAEALERFRAEGQDYKVELIEDLVADQGVDGVSLYTNGPFTDLCRGPHAPATDRIGAFKLQAVAGAYWRGDSTRPMLTRVYGTAFFSKKELAAELERLEQARARDHRKLGPQLGLFQFSEISPGAAFWLPKGTTMFNELVGLTREMGAERGFTEVKTPLLYDSELWKTSGHWGKYRENMFVTETEGRQFGVKPMNCPGHAHLFGLQHWSYRDLPVRFAEPGLLHRNELSGTLHGLLRVRHFIQDDAHIFCTDEQIEDEVRRCLEFSFATFELFGFEVQLEFVDTARAADRDRRDVGPRGGGARARAGATDGHDYELNPGDGAFYGPKIDLHTTDSLGPRVAAGHGPARLLDARALRPHLHGRRQRRPSAGDDPQRAAWAPSSASSGSWSSTTPGSSRSGWRPSRRSCCRSPIATSTPPVPPHRSWAPPESVSRSTSGPSRSAA